MRFQLLYTVHRPLNRCSTCSSSSSSSTQPLREDNQLHRMHSTIRQPDSVCMSDYLGHSRKWKDNCHSYRTECIFYLLPGTLPIYSRTVLNSLWLYNQLSLALIKNSSYEVSLACVQAENGHHAADRMQWWTFSTHSVTNLHLRECERKFISHHRSETSNALVISKTGQPLI